MKQFFSLLLTIVLLSSCNFFHRKANNAIKFAQENYSENPQLSLDTLLSIQYPEKLPQALKAEWALYHTYSLYQLDSIPTSDSIINIACDYYNRTKLDKEDGLAHFLRAYVLKDSDPDEAIEAYKQAIQSLRGADEPNVFGVAAYNIGYLYYLDENYVEALKYHRKAEKQFAAIGNDVNLAYTYREIANVNDLQKNSVDTVLMYFDKAMLIFDTLEYKDDYYDVGLYKATTLMYRTDRLDEAKELLYEVYNHFDGDPYYHIRLSQLYVVRNEFDSAMHYLKLPGNDTTNIYAKATYYKLESSVNALANNYKKAYSSLNNFIDNRLKTIDETRKNRLYRVDKRYDYQEKELENTRLRVRNRTILIYLAFLLVLVLVLLLIFMSFTFKRRKAELTYQLEIKTLRNKHAAKRDLLIETIKTRTENALMFNSMEAKIQKLTVNDIMHELKNFSSIPEGQWTRFVEEVNIIGNDFICALSSMSPTLTLSDKIVIALISLNVDITNACILLNINKNTMYRRRNTIKERLQLDKSVDLDLWIKDFIDKQSIATIGSC